VLTSLGVRERAVGIIFLPSRVLTAEQSSGLCVRAAWQ
jgi:hypothetical protein